MWGMCCDAGFFKMYKDFSCIHVDTEEVSFSFSFLIQQDCRVMSCEDCGFF
jgi:hypothetical protein